MHCLSGEFESFSGQQWKGKSNLLSELWGGEDDQVEEEVGGEGDGGEGDVHVPFQGGIWVEIPKTLSVGIEQGEYPTKLLVLVHKAPLMLHCLTF